MLIAKIFISHYKTWQFSLITALYFVRWTTHVSNPQRWQLRLKLIAAEITAGDEARACRCVLIYGENIFHSAIGKYFAFAEVGLVLYSGSLVFPVVT